MLKVNDRVKITGVNLGKANNYIGKEGVVHTIVGMNDSYGNYVSVKGIKMKSGTFSSWFPTKSLEKIEPEERELKFKVGEQVKIIGYSNLGCDVGTVGEIGIVENTDGMHSPYWVTSKSKPRGLFYGEESLEKVEPAPEPKFKKGDRVYIKDNAINCPAGNATVDSLIDNKITIEVGDEVEIIGKSHTNKINNIGRKATVDLDYEDGDFSVVFSNGIKGVFSSTSLKLLRKAENRVDYPKDDEQKKENSDSFYCCYVEGTGAFYKKHTESEARKECERLTNKEHRKVYLMKAIEVCEVPVKPVEWNKL